jgi:hypothetical protein
MVSVTSALELKIPHYTRIIFFSAIPLKEKVSPQWQAETVHNAYTQDCIRVLGSFEISALRADKTSGIQESPLVVLLILYSRMKTC